MAINVGLGIWLYDTRPRKLPTVVQPPPSLLDAGPADAPALMPTGPSGPTGPAGPTITPTSPSGG
jgi:hypothetical protein